MVSMLNSLLITAGGMGLTGSETVIIVTLLSKFK